MSLNDRIQWLHKKMTLNSYPNAQRHAERFGISHRTAQRDFDYMRRKLGAPIAYDSARRGFYYESPFTLPMLFSSDNDESYIPEIFNAEQHELAADESIIQMQIPYSATVEIRDKLTALELSPYIIGRLSHGRYTCEFHSIEKFIGLLMSLDSDFRVLEPAWLQERLVNTARRVLENHSDI